MALEMLNPQTPFVGTIQHGLKTGMMVLLWGIPDGTRDRFEVDLQSGPSNENDIAFHFNPRFNENTVVTNTYYGGVGWLPEERVGPFPFRANHLFKLSIEVQEIGYQVSVDGQFFCYYNHRIPSSSVTHVRVSNGLKVDIIRVEVCIDNEGTLSDSELDYQQMGSKRM